MRHPQIPAAERQEQTATRDAGPAPDPGRPDLRGPRGNQDRDQVDVERGREKLDRVLGK